MGQSLVQAALLLIVSLDVSSGFVPASLEQACVNVALGAGCRSARTCPTSPVLSLKAQELKSQKSKSSFWKLWRPKSKTVRVDTLEPWDSQKSRPALAPISKTIRVGNLNNAETQCLVTTDQTSWESEIDEDFSAIGAGPEVSADEQSDLEAGEEGTTALTGGSKWTGKKPDALTQLILFHGAKDVAQAVAIASMLWSQESGTGRSFPLCEWALLFLGLRVFSDGIAFPGWDLDHWARSGRTQAEDQPPSRGSLSTVAGLERLDLPSPVIPATPPASLGLGARGRAVRTAFVMVLAKKRHSQEDSSNSSE